MFKSKPEKKFHFSETLLNPKFYTTNFEKLSTVNTFEYTENIRNIVNELEVDYNKVLFSTACFSSEEKKNYTNSELLIILRFLERACVAEFSGFLMYKELSNNLKLKKNFLLAKGFGLLARDEARHAGFLRKLFSELGFSFDLSFLAKTRKYVYFSPRYILYATYLSEKIGYWRYITIYRHLEKNSNFRVFRLFRYFEAWCQDENRHSEFLALLLKSQPQIIDIKKNKFVLKIFVIFFYFTMYLNDVAQKQFYELLGLDQKEYTLAVIKKTHRSLIYPFNAIIEINNTKFFDKLEKIANNYYLLQKVFSNNNYGFIYCLYNIRLIIELIINLTKLFII